MGAPQIIYIILIAISVGGAIQRHGEREIKTHNAWHQLAGAALAVGLLYWGGFFDGGGC